MSIKKLFEELTPEELVEAFVFPVKLTVKQRNEADEQLREARKKTQQEMTGKDRNVSDSLILRFRIEKYLKESNFDPQQTFSHYLKEYVSIFSNKQKVFAQEIDIDDTMLSQLINAHRTPPDYVMIRLELHSQNIIPAEYWYRLVEKEKGHNIKTDKSLRLKEMKHIHTTVSINV